MSTAREATLRPARTKSRNNQFVVDSSSPWWLLGVLLCSGFSAFFLFCRWFLVCLTQAKVCLWSLTSLRQRAVCILSWSAEKGACYSVEVVSVHHCFRRLGLQLLIFVSSASSLVTVCFQRLVCSLLFSSHVVELLARFGYLKTHTIKSKHIKGSKERCLLEQDKTSNFGGLIPFVKLQNDT